MPSPSLSEMWAWFFLFFCLTNSMESYTRISSRKRNQHALTKIASATMNFMNADVNNSLNIFHYELFVHLTQYFSFPPFHVYPIVTINSTLLKSCKAGRNSHIWDRSIWPVYGTFRVENYSYKDLTPKNEISLKTINEKHTVQEVTSELQL